MKDIKVLLVEDNPDHALLAREMLDENGDVQFEIAQTERLVTSLEFLAEVKVDIVLLDLSLPDSRGLDPFTKINAQFPDMPVIVMSGLEDEKVAIDTVKAGAEDYLVKGQFDGNLLRRSITYAIERKLINKELQEAKETYHGFFNNVQTGLFRTRISDGKALEANNRLVEIFGYDSREQFLEEYCAPEHYVDPSARQRLLSEIKEKGFVDNFVAQGIRRDGSTFWSRFSSCAYPEKDYIDNVLIDISLEKESLDALSTTATLSNSAFQSQ